MVQSVRLSTAGGRALPDFLILGAQKAGTTSLYRYLSDHPGVRPAARKEVHFFDVNYDRGERWYRSMFPLRRTLTRESGEGRGLITGEASPYYLFHPLAPQRAAATVPAARLIVLLRDPVERAWSHYRHEVAAGRETLSFADALDTEPARLAGTDAAVRAGAPADALARHRNFSYIARGRYAEQIRAWSEHYPREAFLFLDAEILFTEPERAWASVASFLGLDALPLPQFDVHNAGAAQPMDPTIRSRLAAEFRAPDHDLETLIGMSLSWTSRAN